MENKNKKMSVIEEAVVELQSIVEAADKSAKDKMAKQLPEQFEKLLKEELENNKKESVQESVKDVTKEPVNEGEKTDSDKESLNEMEEIDLTELSINDIEEAYNEANNSDEFEVSPDEIELNDIEDELEEMQNMTADVDNMQQEGDNPSDPFDKIKNLHKMLGEMIQDNEMTNEMHDKVPHGATAPTNTGHDTTSSGINEDKINEALDPVMLGTLIGIFGLPVVTAGIFGIKAMLKKISPKAANVLDQLSTSSVRNSAGGHGSAMGESEEIIDEAARLDQATLQKLAKGLEQVADNNGVAALEKSLQTYDPKALQAIKNSATQGGAAMGESVVTETEEVIDEVDTVDDEGKEEVDEKHGVGFSDGKVRAGTLPNQGAEYRDRKGHSRNRPQWSNESVEKFMTQKENMEKRMTSLINEQKTLTKKLNEAEAKAKKFEKVSEEQVKLQEAMVKYRKQLSEMAVFNTNLASVNNILVNEELALTVEDKKNLIARFKDVKTIQESEDTYKAVLSEMTSEKKNIVESVEEKVSDSVGESSSSKVNEKTAYVNEHVEKIKGLMKYVDNHGNSRILS